MKHIGANLVEFVARLGFLAQDEALRKEALLVVRKEHLTTDEDEHTTWTGKGVGSDIPCSRGATLI